MLPWDRLIAGATEVAEAVRIGVDWGGCAERDADAGEESDEGPEAVARGVYRTHQHPSAEYVIG
jgi:hypothetical protein